jgi:DNA-binding CsgD family transcriptional regulator
VYAVAAALSRDRAAPSARVRAPSGRWLALHASRLDGADEGRIAVVVEPCAPRATLPIRLAAYGLSRREAEVARLVLRGSSTRAIATALHISPHTVQDHLKSVFDKLGVRSRRDLVGLMLGG